MFASHAESGGELVEIEGKLYKQFYGMSSAVAMNKHAGRGGWAVRWFVCSVALTRDQKVHIIKCVMFIWVCLFIFCHISGPTMTASQVYSSLFCCVKNHRWSC